MPDWSVTVRQPWAWAIVSGVRPVECRNFRPAAALPGDRLVIVSGLVVTHAELQTVGKLVGARLCVFDGSLFSLSDGPYEGDEYTGQIVSGGALGAVVGSVTYMGAHRTADCAAGSECDRWTVPGYAWHWELSDAAVLAGPAFRGHQGIRRFVP